MTAPSPNPETIERELAELGEAPPSADELAMLAGLGELGELDDLDDPDLAAFARLQALADPIAFDDLSQLETHRGWRVVEQRLDPAHEREAAPTSARPADDKHTGGGPRRWLFAAVGVAAAAALALIVVGPGSGSNPTPDARTAQIDPAAAAELGEQARTTLAALAALDGGLSDTERAEQLAREYQQRLEEQGG